MYLPVAAAWAVLLVSAPAWAVLVLQGDVDVWPAGNAFNATNGDLHMDGRETPKSSKTFVVRSGKRQHAQHMLQTHTFGCLDQYAAHSLGGTGEASMFGLLPPRHFDATRQEHMHAHMHTH